MNRARAIATVIFAVLLCSLAVPALAQQYPSRPVRLVVPFPPGGGADVVARIVSPKLQERLGQPVVVENKGGAGATIGGDAVAKAQPDGYTLLYGTPGVQITNPFLMKKLPYDPMHDFTPIVSLVVVPNVLVVHPSVPAKTVRELIELARTKPGALNFSSSGVGSSQHLAGELFNMMAGVRNVHVAYKGSGQGLQDLLSGNIQMSIESVNVVLPHIKAGKLRALAVSVPEKSPALPDLPTIAETLPGFDAAAFNYITAPARTPRPIVDRLNKELNAVLAMAEIRERLLALGVTTVGGTPEQLDARIKSESAKWKKVIDAAGVKPE